MSQSDADCDDGGDRGNGTPQPMHSVPSAQIGYPAPGPPSSQSPSEARLHVSVQRICAPVTPTLMARRTGRRSSSLSTCVLFLREITGTMVWGAVGIKLTVNVKLPNTRQSYLTSTKADLASRWMACS
jgi:hypothetical protein